MTNKLYYDCPIQALYMSKNFDIWFLAGDQACYNYKSILTYNLTLESLKNKKKYYIHPDSLHIFEPKEGDFGVNSNGVIQTIFDSEDGWVSTVNHARSSSIEDSKIIMRDGKQFFMPKEEDESN